MAAICIGLNVLTIKMVVSKSGSVRRKNSAIIHVYKLTSDIWWREYHTTDHPYHQYPKTQGHNCATS